MLYEVAVVTASRAEYGILVPLLRAIDADDLLKLNLLVTGMHLSHRYGYTVDEIKNDGFVISKEIEILSPGNAPYDASATMANALLGFAEYFRDNRPDVLVILGDRTEMLGVGVAAFNERIPIVHISGGEVSGGAVDEAIRHSLSKMAYLHFTGTEIARKRVIQLGEAPDRVYNTGFLNVENIRKGSLYSENDIRGLLGIGNREYVLVTYHPVTMEGGDVLAPVRQMCAAMDDNNSFRYIITMSNCDAGGDSINEYLTEYAKNRENVMITPSLGMKKYLSALSYASFVLGNSSSGLGEAPILGIPSINIGNRQKGRCMSETVRNCEPLRDSIDRAIKKASIMKHIPSDMFGDGNTSIRMVEILKDYLVNRRINLLDKQFYDLQ